MLKLVLINAHFLNNYNLWKLYTLYKNWAQTFWSWNTLFSEEAREKRKCASTFSASAFHVCWLRGASSNNSTLFISCNNNFIASQPRLFFSLSPVWSTREKMHRPAPNKGKSLTSCSNTAAAPRANNYIDLSPSTPDHLWKGCCMRGDNNALGCCLAWHKALEEHKKQLSPVNFSRKVLKMY